VLFATPADLVTGPSVFDAAHEHGFVRFRGSRAYPFSIKPNAQPTHADHACVAFDARATSPIWCASPQRLPKDGFWRQFRLAGGIDPGPSPHSFFRCMALCHPGLKPSELVPRSSLVPDQVLQDLTEQHFGTSGKTPAAPKRLPTAALKNDRILAVTTMKNEGPFILEWLAWHRSVGITDFLVYTNDCDDGTDQMFDLLAHRGLVEHRQNPFRQTGERPQHAAYHHAASTDVARSADWIICMDADEFMNIHVGEGHVQDLFAAAPDANMISATWRLFGNADITHFADTPIIEQFDLAAPPLCRKPHQAWGFKTLFRNLGIYRKFGVHRPKGLNPAYLDQINWVNGSGDQIG